jgi:hypothetical protein
VNASPSRSGSIGAMIRVGFRRQKLLSVGVGD